MAENDIDIFFAEPNNSPVFAIVLSGSGNDAIITQELIDGKQSITGVAIVENGCTSHYTAIDPIEVATPTTALQDWNLNGVGIRPSGVTGEASQEETMIWDRVKQVIGVIQDALEHVAAPARPTADQLSEELEDVKNDENAPATPYTGRDWISCVEKDWGSCIKAGRALLGKWLREHWKEESLEDFSPDKEGEIRFDFDQDDYPNVDGINEESIRFLDIKTGEKKPIVKMRPTAVIELDDDDFFVGETTFFSARNSADPESSPKNMLGEYRWELIPASEQGLNMKPMLFGGDTISFTPATEGIYTLTLRVQSRKTGLRDTIVKNFLAKPAPIKEEEKPSSSDECMVGSYSVWNGVELRCTKGEEPRCGYAFTYDCMNGAPNLTMKQCSESEKAKARKWFCENICQDPRCD